MSRLPRPGKDSGTWGQILNDYLSQSHSSDGTLKADSVGSTQLQDNSVTATTIANDAVTAAAIKDGTITESQLSTATQTKLNASGDWNTLNNKPTVIASGDTQANARTAIGAGTSNLSLGTTGSTAKAGDYQPTSTDILDSTATGRSLLTASDTSAARTAISAAPQLSPVSTKTAMYSTTANELVPADASSGGFTVNLPSAPSDGTLLAVKKTDTTNNVVTVQRGGTDVFNTSGGPTTLQLATPDQTVTLQYNGGIWYVIQNGVSTTSFDSKYFIRDESGSLSRLMDQNGAVGFAIQTTASAVNYLRAYNSATGGYVMLRAGGTDPNVSISIRPQGAGYTQVLNGSGNVIAVFATDSTPVNYFTFTNGDSGVAPTISAGGSDSNISINAIPKGTGTLQEKGVPVATKIVGSATLDFPSISASSYQDLTITVTGAVDGDVVELGIPNGSRMVGIRYEWWVSATNTVTVRAHNYTAGALDPASGMFKAVIIR